MCFAEERWIASLVWCAFVGFVGLVVVVRKMVRGLWSGVKSRRIQRWNFEVEPLRVRR